MFRIKICGVTSATDARAVASAGADAVGLNLFAGSKRYLHPETAKEVAEAVPNNVLKIGVFVNTAAESVCRDYDRLRLDLIQLAGDEPPEYLLRLGRRPVMKVFRPQFDSEISLSTVRAFLRQAERTGCMPKFVLIDASCRGEFGGTGKTLDWAALARSWTESRLACPPLVLAGGLRHDNVQQAIKTLRPAAVDVASGVESSAGVKDPILMAKFVSAAVAAFEGLAPHQPRNC